jgi:hypothetical protein
MYIGMYVCMNREIGGIGVIGGIGGIGGLDTGYGIWDTG